MKLEKLRTLLSEVEIDGLVITSSFNLQYMTSSTGSAVLAVVSKDRAAFI
ncbi:aminopeptidase P family N-terminal domain-containing protein, partial [Bacillus pumilus]